MPNVAVTLSVRVWIEIISCAGTGGVKYVTLSVRVWIEIATTTAAPGMRYGHPQCEGVD